MMYDRCNCDSCKEMRRQQNAGLAHLSFVLMLAFSLLVAAAVLL